MKRIEVTKKSLDLKEWVRRSAVETDFSTLIKEDAAIFIDGKLRVIYKKLAFDQNEIVKALQTIKFQETTRTSGLVTTSRIFGYMPRIVQRSDYCRIASLAKDFPKEHDIVCRYAKMTCELYQKEDPDMYKIHEYEARTKVRPQYIIPGTPFTSGIINKNNPLKYHFDSGNFKSVYSNMLAFKHNVTGGYLSLPEYDIGLEIADNSVLIFDGQGILHGVTPFKLTAPDGYRYTIVYYSLQQMWKCLPLDEELIRIRNKKTERELKRMQSSPETLGDIR